MIYSKIKFSTPHLKLTTSPANPRPGRGADLGDRVGTAVASLGEKKRRRLGEEEKASTLGQRRKRRRRQVRDDGVGERLRAQVHKQGVALGRSVDLTKFDGYDQLIEELDQLFEFKGELMSPNKNWMIVFTDNECLLEMTLGRNFVLWSSENTEEECVAMLDHLFPSNNLSISAECDGQNGVPKPAQLGGRVPELEEIKYMQSLYMKSIVAALRSLKQIRSKSSTVKTD
ncbi:hypothetical protein ZIOFF_020525 [Zingiber officinale]|uniref:Uncharacterized protein n=1 Tax=Zingiber officinale TaxID=94328 RepID=A0A8J5LGN6_ZINOF|nr:hypothetical protein ZIOFF_020525 [Zingiber officinale]